MLLWLMLGEAMQLEAVVDAASAAARAAGQLIVEAGPEQRAVASTKANAKDLLTATDLASQDLIQSVLASRCPEIDFLGEEGGVEKPLDNCWVVDPIDGTTNFVDGLPLSVVSIAYAREGETLAGVVYDPFRDELFAGARGRGATVTSGPRKNRRPLAVSAAERLEDAIVFAGAPPNPLSLAPSLRGIAALAPRVRTLRLLGSAALMLAYVADGRGAAYFEPDLAPWDTAAGALLA
ncbi:hypothetical protein CTAYLR_006514 [Chrysophaeum taylorii]|uniref:Inositol-1-monophosphatase n=1 Tax=Chrysophaeum taylorii TaxID=2483200 RepID=A0AAD7XLJ5_9STRA|nr:hypothetical protein CTAYLR_006514 [Chrysophaeum taylorii]